MLTQDNIKGLDPPIQQKIKELFKMVVEHETALIRHEKIENLTADALAQYEHDGRIEVDTHLKLKKLINSEA